MFAVTDMPAKKAVIAYREKRLNCAQSVFYAFNASAETLSASERLGRGRSEGGLCGALHAALELVASDRRESLRRGFAEKAGSERCVEIRKERKLHCVQCVELAALLVQPEAG